MKSYTIHEPGEHVKIKELDLLGTVRGADIGFGGIRYFVTYFWEGKLQEVYLLECEIDGV